MKLNFASKSCGRSRVARMEPCHWSQGYDGVSLQERTATMQVMLGMSLRARWDATLVSIITAYMCVFFKLALFLADHADSTAVCQPLSECRCCRRRHTLLQAEGQQLRSLS